MNLPTDADFTRIAALQYRRGHYPIAPQQVAMPCCGTFIYFPTAKSIPKKNLRCPCGERNVYVVYWEKP